MVEPGQALILDQGCLPIGIGTDYQEHTVALNSGSRVYLYSDGVTEAMNSGNLFGQERLIETLENLASIPLRLSVAKLAEKVRQWRGGTAIRDDVSILPVDVFELIWNNQRQG